MARERERKKERKYSKGVEDIKKEREGQKKMSKNAKKECRVLAKSNDTEKERQIKQNNETEAKQKVTEGGKWREVSMLKRSSLQ